MAPLGSVEAVVAAIREDAHAEVERIERERDASAARIRAEDAAAPVVVADAEVRLSAARREARERAAAEDWADRQSRALARDRWMRVVAERARQQLRDATDAQRRADLLTCAGEAIAQMPAGGCELLVAARDLVLLDERWRDALHRTVSRPVTIVACPEIDGGCVARSPDGRLRFDNTLAARETRFEPHWRRRLAECFERLPVAHG
jgi:vacuolar-type H+-ATPase subunit E/Vma4